MKLEGQGERLTIFVGESDQHGHRPLYTEVVARAHRMGMAGATVLRGIEGFGASSRIHAPRLLRLSEDLPVAIIIVDQPERIAAFLPVLDDLVSEGLVVREEVEIIVYRGRPRP